VDEAGNEGEQEEFLWTVDTTPPKTVIKQAPKRFTKSKVAIFAIRWGPRSAVMNFRCRFLLAAMVVVC
jgi:hypothetical protein